MSARRQVMNVREARLKPQYAAEYPGVSAGVWMSANELAGKLVDRVHACRKEGRYTRTFDPTHFEFRGGESMARRPGNRTRSTDLCLRPSDRPIRQPPMAGNGVG